MSDQTRLVSIAERLGARRSDAPYQAAEVSPFECFEIWKRLNGRPETLTLAEKGLYEAVCRRLAVEVLPELPDILNAS